jgi:hypothetical protein
MSEQTERTPIPRARLKPDSDVRARLIGKYRPEEEIRAAFGWRAKGTFYNWCRRGMPYLQIGMHRYGDPEAIHQYFVDRQKNPNPRPIGRPRKGTK